MRRDKYIMDGMFNLINRKYCWEHFEANGHYLCHCVKLKSIDFVRFIRYHWIINCTN